MNPKLKNALDATGAWFGRRWAGTKSNWKAVKAYMSPIVKKSWEGIKRTYGRTKRYLSPIIAKWWDNRKRAMKAYTAKKWKQLKERIKAFFKKKQRGPTDPVKSLPIGKWVIGSFTVIVIYLICFGHFSGLKANMPKFDVSSWHMPSFSSKDHSSAPAKVTTDEIPNNPQMHYGLQYFEQGVPYTFFIEAGGKKPWLIQEKHDTTRFRIQEVGKNDIFCVVEVIRDGTHLVSPVIVAGDDIDHPAFVTIVANHTGYVNVAREYKAIY